MFTYFCFDILFSLFSFKIGILFPIIFPIRNFEIIKSFVLKINKICLDIKQGRKLRILGINFLPEHKVVLFFIQVKKV